MLTKGNSVNSKGSNRVTSLEPLNKIIVGQIELSFLNRSVSCCKQLITITGLEFNLLALLMQSAGEIVTRECIAEKVFQRDLHRCDKSINSHIVNLRKKFLTISPQAVIKTVRGQGYIFIR
ncbi:winged helix-turn-helix domain-containing protein [Colwellia sp. E2M01]|uniref:winged helix-turn-helix domain-containing protein n=1 Tax=Colwellia sp. E2M01 TaxID=2841561 RepID=UPI001C07EFD0|nr:winged helix-turn-helix domain-containing protein [Colwellia sp. E2M01]MBU2872136.1 winged helix-turn-helix domain-containing protein [Colwellia sp. E2M01]